MARGWHYTKLSLSSALLLSFSGMCFALVFLSFCRFCFVFCSRCSFVDAPLIFSYPADRVLPDWQPRVYFTGYGCEARSVENTSTTNNDGSVFAVYDPT